MQGLSQIRDGKARLEALYKVRKRTVDIQEKLASEKEKQEKKEREERNKQKLLNMKAQGSETKSNLSTVNEKGEKVQIDLPVVNPGDDWKGKCIRPAYKEMKVTSSSRWNNTLLKQLGGFDYHECESFSTLKFPNHSYDTFTKVKMQTWRTNDRSKVDTLVKSKLQKEVRALEDRVKAVNYRKKKGRKMEISSDCGLYEGRSGVGGGGVRTPSEMSRSASPSKVSSPTRVTPGMKLGHQQTSPGKSALKQPRDFTSGNSEMQSTFGASRSGAPKRTVQIKGQESEPIQATSGGIDLTEHNQNHGQALWGITEDTDKSVLIELILKTQKEIDDKKELMAKKMHNKGKKEKENIKVEFKKEIGPLERNLEI